MKKRGIMKPRILYAKSVQFSNETFNLPLASNQIDYQLSSKKKEPAQTGSSVINLHQKILGYKPKAT